MYDAAVGSAVNSTATPVVTSSAEKRRHTTRSQAARKSASTRWKADRSPTRPQRSKVEATPTASKPRARRLRPIAQGGLWRRPAGPNKEIEADPKRARGNDRCRHHPHTSVRSGVIFGKLFVQGPDGDDVCQRNDGGNANCCQRFTGTPPRANSGKADIGVLSHRTLKDHDITARRRPMIRRRTIITPTVATVAAISANVIGPTS